MAERLAEIIALVLGGFVVAVTLLGFLTSKAWWIRIWDFPRFQLALVGASSLALFIATDTSRAWPSWLFVGVLGAAVAFQTALVWRYSRLAPFEVQSSRSDQAPRLTLAVSNVLQTNRDADRLIRVLTDADADVMLFLETDDWWRERLDALLRTHPHTVQHPLANTYGMLLYSRLPLTGTTVDFLVEPDVPSIQARVRLAEGATVWLNCVHPRPPAPSESDESLERDAELLLVGRRVCGAAEPVVVCGDLNDVAWSRTTRLFQKTSGLVDPRKGRGMFSTFHARLPGLRFPLDHILHSTEFRLVRMRRLADVGSDHFPVVATLSLEPEATTEQAAPTADTADSEETRETIAKAGAGSDRGARAR